MPHQHTGRLCRAPEELAPEELAVLDRARSRAAQATSPAQPHHGALDLAGTVDWNLDKFARVRVAVVGHPLGTKNLQGLGDLRRREFDNYALLPEIRKDLTTDEKGVFGVLLLTVDILPGAKPFNNCGKWIHAISGSQVRWLPVWPLRGANSIPMEPPPRYGAAEFPAKHYVLGLSDGETCSW